MDDPTFVNYLRIGYVAAQLLAIGVYFYCQMAAKRKNDLTVLKYVNPPSPMVRLPFRPLPPMTQTRGRRGARERDS